MVSVLTILMFGLAVPALAKGPESGTLSGPGIAEPIELFDQRPAQEIQPPPSRLLDLTHLWRGAPPPTSPPANLGEAYTITWVNMGPPSATAEERTIVQHIYLDAEGGPLIHTPDQPGLEGWGDGVTGWFEATALLKDTIKEIAAMAKGSEETATPAWLLPVVAFGTVTSLTGLGRRLSLRARRPAPVRPATRWCSRRVSPG